MRNFSSPNSTLLAKVRFCDTHLNRQCFLHKKVTHGDNLARSGTWKRHGTFRIQATPYIGNIGNCSLIKFFLGLCFYASRVAVRSQSWEFCVFGPELDFDENFWSLAKFSFWHVLTSTKFFGIWVDLCGRGQNFLILSRFFSIFPVFFEFQAQIFGIFG